MIKKCIIFDNEDQSESIEKLIRIGKEHGIDIECEQFNIGSTELTEVLTDGRIDINKVVIEYKKKFKNIIFHLSAFDWQLDDDNIDGVELIRQLKANKILTNTPKIIYSGLLNDILSSLILKTEDKNRTKKLSSLVNNDIRGFYEREKYEIDIINFFSSDTESLDLIIEEVLRKFPDLVFKNEFVNKKFNGKTFLEIAEFIENYEHIKNDFKKEIISQVISYLTEKI